MTTIPRRKSTIVQIIIPIGFVLIGFKIINKAIAMQNTGLHYLLFALGIGCIMIFGAIGLLQLSHFLNKKAGISFSNYQLIFHPNSLLYAEVDWGEIQELELIKKGGQDCIIPILKSPEKVIENQHSFLARWIMKNNMKMLKTPIPILPGNYDYNPELLVKEITSAFNNKNKKY